MNTMLTVIVSPAVAGVVLAVVLAGGSLMYHIVRKKYGYGKDTVTLDQSVLYNR